MPRIRNMLKCSFCGKPHSDVAKLIAGPNVFICDEDIERALAGPGISERAKCSFCGKWTAQVEKIYGGPEAFICDGCIAMCVEIDHVTGEASTEDQSAGELVEARVGSAPLSRTQRLLIRLLRKTGVEVTVHARRR